MPDAQIETAKADTPRGGRRHFIAWSLLGLVAGVALAAGLWWAIGGKVWTDGRDLRVPASRTSPREVLWTPPKPLDASFNTPDQEYEPSVSPDGTELYFVRGKAARNADVFVSHRRNNQWTAPEAVAGVNSAYDDLGPRLTADGRYLLFYSDRPGGVGQYDVWAAPRLPDGGWGEPFNLGPTVNSEFNEFNPAPTPDGKRLIFATNRKAASSEQKEAWRATIRQSALGDYDLFVADVDATSATQPASPSLGYRPAAEIAGVNTEYHEGASCVSPAGDFLYFASNRPGGYGKFDLYRSRILPDGGDGAARFGPPENVGPGVNTPDNEADPQLALGGFHLLFSSDRPQAAGAGAGGYDLFAADSREVFAERAGRPLPTLGWSWWVLLGSLLLLIPLLKFFRGWNDHRLNVLQKCLLVSLLLHVLFTIALSFVAVTHQVIEFAKQEIGIGEIAAGADGNRDVEIGLAIRSGGGGPGLPVAAEAPPSIDERAVAGSDAIVERPQTLDAGSPQASAASDASMVVPAAVPPRAVPANTSGRVTLATPADQTAAPQVSLALQPPVSEAERPVRPAAADVTAEKLTVPGAAAEASPQSVRLAANPAAVDPAAPSSFSAAPAPAARAGTFAPQAFRPGTAVLYADASPAVDAPQPRAGKISAAEDERSLASGKDSGGPGGGGLKRAEVALAPAGPGGVDVPSPAAAASGQSFAQNPSPTQAMTAGRPGIARSTVAGLGTPVAAKPDATQGVGDIVATIPGGAGTHKAPIESSPTLAAADQSAPVSRASTVELAGPPGGAGGGGTKLGTVAIPAARAMPGAESGGGAPMLPSTRPAVALGPAGGGAGSRPGVGDASLAAVAPAVGAPAGGGAGRAPVKVETAGAASIAPDGAAGAVKQDTSPASAGPGPKGVADAVAYGGGGSVAPTRAGESGSLASAAATGPRQFVANGKPTVPPGAAAGAGRATGVEGPSVSLALPHGGAKPGKAGPSGGTESTPSAAEAVVASERVKPGDATTSRGNVPAVALAAGPVGPARFSTRGAPGDSGGGGVRPRAGDVAAVPLNLEIAITAPDLGAAAPLAQRAPEARKPLLEKWGGTKESEDAVERALDYLARNQEPGGRWTYVERRTKPGERDTNPHDTAITGLATLAFLAADHTPANDGPYRETVTSAVNFLLASQRANGDLRGAQPGGGADAGNMYDQGIATLALCEAAQMTGDKRLTEAALRGAQFIVKAQNRESGGWRYLPGESGDTSVFGWQVMALHSARQLGFEVPEKTRQNALRYVAFASTGRNRTLAGYQPGHGPSQAMTAELLFARMLLGDELTDEGQQEACDYLTRQLPDARRADFYGWYYGSLSLLQLQNDAWKKWNERTRETLVNMQKRGGADDGCWDGNIQWRDRGGRIYSTALGALTLEVYYRYLPLSAERQNAVTRPVTQRALPDIGYLAR